MDAPRVTQKGPAHLDDEQAWLFVEALIVEDDIRVKASLLLLIYSGCRVGELCGLE
ncbi:MAG: hypothetical protein LBS19_05730 [Clostridiales bacterium]|jgi:integrase|nr:hypothetical protein [Clostridiales bacterium]